MPVNPEEYRHSGKPWSIPACSKRWCKTVWDGTQADALYVQQLSLLLLSRIARLQGVNCVLCCKSSAMEWCCRIDGNVLALGNSQKNNEMLWGQLLHKQIYRSCDSIVVHHPLLMHPIVIKEMFPDGDTKKWLGATRRPETAGSAFKKSMATMIQELNSKVSCFTVCSQSWLSSKLLRFCLMSC